MQKKIEKSLSEWEIRKKKKVHLTWGQAEHKIQMQSTINAILIKYKFIISLLSLQERYEKQKHLILIKL